MAESAETVAAAPQPDPAPARGPNQDRSLASSLAWVGGIRWASQVASWISTMLVFRVLVPTEIGIVTMATSFLGLVSLLNEFGISGAILYTRDLSARQVAQINGLSVMIGASCFTLGAAASGAVAAYYRVPDVQLVVVLLSLNFITASFQSVPLAMLRRDLNFRAVALNDAIQAIVLAVVSVTLAYLGFGYWTLVIANLLGMGIRSAAAVARRPCPFQWPMISEIRSLIRFGSHMTLSRLAWFVYSNADFWVVGRVLGAGPAGAYGLAWNLATMPVEKISSVILQVTPAFLSSLNRNVVESRRLLLLVIEGTALAAMPATVGLALVADIFVPTLLGEKWAAAVLPLQILALYTTFRTITALLPPVLFTWGMTLEALHVALLSAVVMPIAFIIGVKWGLVGIAVAWAVAYPILSVPLYRLVLRNLEMSLKQLLAALVPAAGFTAVMAAVVITIRTVLGGRMAPVPLLGILVAGGLVSYAACIRLGYWTRARKLYQTIRPARKP